MDTVGRALGFPVLHEVDETGMYVASCPLIRGCYSQGDTLAEAEGNIRECILLCLEDMEEHGEELPARVAGTDGTGG